MKFAHTTQSGYSLVETLVAISILLLSIVGPMTIAAKGIQTGIFVSEQTTAVFLAQEGVEAVLAIRNEYALENIGTDDVWDWTRNNGPLAACLLNVDEDNRCAIHWENNGNPLYRVSSCTGANDDCALKFDESGDRARYIVSSDSSLPTSPYRKYITIERTATDEVEVVSTVSWNTNLFGGERTVELRSSVYNLYGE